MSSKTKTFKPLALGFIALISFVHTTAFAQTPFVCDGTPYTVIGEPSVLQEVDKNTLAVTGLAALTPTGAYINALAMNNLDSYIYALAGSNAGGFTPKELVRVGADSSVVSLGIPTSSGSAVWSPVPITGTMDTSGKYYTLSGTYLYIVDIGNNPAAGTLTYTAITRSGITSNPNDITFSTTDGMLYGSIGAGLVQINPATGVGVIIPTTGDSLGAAGGAWSNGIGEIFFYNNGGAKLYKVNNLGGGGTPVVEFLGAVAKNGKFDATACVPPVLTKDALVTTTAAGSSFDYEYTIYNPYALPVSVDFTDILPTNLTYDLSSLTPNPPGGGTVSTFTTTDLVIDNITVAGNGQIAFTVTVNVDVSAPAGDIDNQATLNYGGATLNSDEPDSGEIEDPTTVTITAPVTAKLTLQKTVTNDNGGTAVDTAWTLSATDGTTTISGVEGDTAITSATMNPGTYNLSETGGPTDYTQTSLVCTGAADTDPSNGLTLAAGEDATCTFTNDDDLPAAPLTPFACNANFYETIDGQLSVFDTATSTYTAIGPDQEHYNATGYNVQDNFIYGIGREGSIDNKLLRIGSDGSYEVVAGIGTVSPASSGTINLNNIYYHSFLPTTMKSIDLANLAAGETTITFSGSTGLPTNREYADGAFMQYAGKEYIVAAKDGVLGIYNLTDAVITTKAVTGLETGSYGSVWATSDGRFYAAANNSGLIYAIDDVLSGTPTIAFTVPAAMSSKHDGMNCYNGGSPFVTTAKLTLQKTVINDDGGTAINTNWTLTATDGTTTISGAAGDTAITAAEVDPGTYTLSETGGPTAYTQTSLVCTGAADTDPSDGLTLAIGEEATCTFTNDDLPATIEVAKTASLNDGGDGSVDAGDTITYLYEVENTGGVNVFDIAVTESASSFTGTGTLPTPTYVAGSGGGDLDAEGDAIDLAPAETLQFESTYTLTQADIDAGMVDNQANASATGPNGPLTDISDNGDDSDGNDADDSTVTTLSASPDLQFTKGIDLANSSLSTPPVAGDTVAYTFTVENTGNVTLTNVSIADSLVTVNGGPIASLAVGAIDSTTFTASYTLTQADIDAGGIENTATASGTPPPAPDGTPATPITDTSDSGDESTETDALDPADNDGDPTNDPTVLSLSSDPELTIAKSAGVITTANGADAGATDALDTITYSYTVTNSGNVTMSGITVADVGPTFNGAAGTGAMGAVSCDVTTLAPNAVATCSASYTLSQVDIDNAIIGGTDAVENSATGSGFDPSQDPATDTPTTSGPGTAVTTIVNEPELTIVKTAGAITTANGVDTGATDALDTITYAYTVTNSGNVTMSAITVADAGPTFNGIAGTGTMGAVSCDVTTLAPGAAATCSAVYTLSQVDADNAVAGGANAVENSATGSGFDPSQDPATDTPTTSAPGTAATTIASDPELTIEKTTGAITTGNGVDTGATDALDTITYAYTVTNSGNVTMSAITVADAGPTFNGIAGTGTMGAVSCDVTTLAPGAVATCSAVYTLSQVDADNAVAGGANAVANSATGSGFDPSQDPATDTPTTSAPGTAVTTIASDPELTIEKTAGVITTANGADAGATDALDTITYNYSVTNSGNVTMSAITVADAGPTFNGVAGTGTMGAASCDVTTLAPGAIATCSAIYTLSQADADNAVAGGTDAVANSATGSGFDPSQDPATDTPTTSAGDTAVTTIVNDPELTTDKTAGAITTANGVDTGATDALDTITYAYTVTNSGNVTMSAITVTDAGPTFNGVAGTGTMGAVSCDVTTLAPGAVASCSAVYTLSQADADNAVAGGANAVENSATSSGFDPSQDPATDTPTTSAPDTAVTTIANNPELTTEKTAGVITTANGVDTGATDALDTITYAYTVTNSGNVTMSAITVADAGPTFNGIAGTGAMGAVSCDVTTLAPGAVATCSAIYTLSQVDADNAVAGGANAVANSATSSGFDPSQDPAIDTPTTSAPGTAVTSIAPDPELTIEKTAGVITTANGADTGATDALDTITYAYTVTNSGNVTMSAISVADAGPTFNGVAGTGTMGAASCDVTTLAPGAIAICSAIYTLSQADADNAVVGGTDAVANSATGSGFDPSQDPATDTPTTSDPDTAVTTIANDPELTIVKTAGAITTANGVDMGATDALDTITYAYSVTNTGNVTMSAITVADAGPTFNGIAGTGTMGAVSCDVTTVAPGAVATCSAVYTLSQIDADNAVAGGANAVANSATGSGFDPSQDPSTDTPTTSAPNTAVTTIANNPELTTEKTAGAITTANGVDTGATDALDTITYAYTVTNSGNVTMSAITVADVGPTFNGIAGTGTMSAVSCDVTTLAPGAVATCSAVYTLSQVDADNAVTGGTDAVANSATSSGFDPSQDPATDTPTTSAPDTAVTTIANDPELTTEKTAGAITTANGIDTGATDALDTITYAYTVTNSGNVTMSGITVADAGPTFNGIAGTGTMGAVSCDVTTLAPGAVATCSAVYTLSQVDADNAVAGGTDAVANSATGSGFDPSQNPATDTPTASAPSTAVTTIVQDPELTIEKTAGAITTANGIDTGATDALDTITYAYTVTNSGNVTMSGITVADAGPTFNGMAGTGTMGAVSCDVTTVAPGAVATCSAVYTLSQIDADNAVAGGTDAVANSATGSGFDPSQDPTTDTPTTSVPNTAVTTIANNPELTTEKTAGAITTANGVDTGATDALDTITYAYTVTNSGNVTMSAITVADVGPTFNGIAGTGTMSAVSCDVTTLAPGAVATCSAVYTLSQVDADNAVTGGTDAVANSATSSGFDPSQDPATDTPTTSAPDTAVTTIANDPELSIEKTAGTITTVKGADASATDALDTITYNYSVTNSGNVTMSAITVADAGPTFNGVTGSGTMSAVSCDITTLAPGAVATCSAVYTLSQADADNAVIGGTDSVANSATGSGFDPSQDPTTDTPTISAPDTALTTIANEPELTIEKTAGAITTANGVDKGATDALDTITYAYTVTNSGNVTMSGITVADAGPTFNGLAGTGTMGAISCDVTTLAPGAVATCEAEYVLSQADADNAVAGGTDAIVNSATGSGFDPSQNPATDTPTTSAPDTAETTIANGPHLTIEKTAGAITIANGVDTGATDALDTITYAYSVRNTGNVTMSAITVADAGPTFNGVAGTGTMGAVSCDVTTLAPGAVATCTAEYVLSQVDADNAVAGGTDAVANSATGSGFDPSQDPATDTPTTSAPDTAVTTIANDPELTIEKTAGMITTAMGVDTGATDALDTIAYAYTVTNTGNVTMSAITVADAGPTFNGVAGTGTMGAVSCDVTTLAPGAVATCSAEYVLSQADADNAVAGGTDAVANSATGSGFDPSQDPTTDTPTTSAPGTVVTTIANDPELTVEKTAGTITTAMGVDTGATDALDTIAYAYSVSNTGNVTMSAITVADAGPTFNGMAGTGTMGAVSCDTTTLAPGAVATCSAVYTLSQADADNAVAGGTDAIANTATTSGFDPSQDPATDTPTTSAPDTAVTTLANDPEMTVEKTAGAITTANGVDTGATDALDTIAYSYVVTNTGNVTMSAITVADAGPTFNGVAGTGTMGAVSCDLTTLAPGAVATCSAVYTLSQADADNAVAGGTDAIANSATTSGFDPSQDPATDTPTTSAPDTALTTIANDPELTIEKTAGAITTANGVDTGATDALDTIAYNYVVTNTGNVTMSAITVADAGPTFNGVAGTGTMGAASCDVTTLAPGAVATCTAEYVLSQADADNAVTGGTDAVANSATGSGFDPSQDPTDPNATPITSAPDTAVTTIANNPELTIEKTAGTVTMANGADTAATDALDTITYNYSVSNTGNVTMSAITVADAGPTFNGMTGTGTMGAVSCDITTLAPGAVASCSAIYILSQADADNAVAGGTDAIANTATGSGFDPSQDPATDTPTTSAPDTALTMIGNDPELTVEKTAGAISTAMGIDTGATDALDTITYGYAVTNTGNVTMSAITVADAGPTFNGVSGTGTMGAVSCDVTTLAPAAVATCSAVYTLSQADADNAVAGGTDAVANSATTSGFDPSQDPATDTPTTSAPDTALTTIANDPELTIEKTAGAITTANGIDTGATDALDTISYSYAVTNTGNVTMSAITVADAGPTFNGVAGTGTMAAVSCDVTTLAPGAVATCSAVYTLSQADADNAVAGGTDAIANSATTSGFDPSQDPATDTPPTSAPDTAVTTIANDPELTIEKMAGAITTASGIDTGATDALDTISYSYVVTNTGNVTMSAITVADAGPTFNGVAGSGTMGAITCDATTLAPGAVATCSAAYTLSQADADNSVIGGTDAVANTATAAGFDPSQDPATDTPTTSAPDTAVTTIANEPELTIEKTAGAVTVVNGADTAATDALDTITYAYAVTNSGNVTMSAITIADAGPTFNGATGTGTMGAVSCDVTTLVPGAVAACSAVYTLSQTDADNAVSGGTDAIANTATASGFDPSQDPATDTPTTSAPDTALTMIGNDPELTVEKTAGAISTAMGIDTGATDALDTIAYGYVVTNTGNVTMSEITVADAGPTFNGVAGTGTMGAVSCDVTTLAPGAVATCSAVYTLSQVDADNAVAGGTDAVANRATTSGFDPSQDPTDPNAAPTTSAPDTAVTTIANNPELTIEKTAGAITTANGVDTGATDALDTIAYNYVVTNTGNVTMSAVTVADAGPTFNGVAGTGTMASVSCDVTTLAPGAAATCTAQYVLSQVDADNAVAGGTDAVANSATGSGFDPSQDPTDPNATPTTSAPDTAVTTIANDPELTIEKTAGAISTANGVDTDATDALDTIAYAYRVSNTGNVTMSAITVADAGPTFNGVAGTGTMAAVSCDVTTLAPGAVATCTAEYVLSQADADNAVIGGTDAIANTATGSGFDPSQDPATDTPITSAPDTALTMIGNDPELTVEKTAGTITTAMGIDTGATDALDTIAYNYVVSNTGNVTMSAITVADAGPTFNGVAGTGTMSAVSCDVTKLAPGAVATCSAVYTLSQADADNAIAGGTDAIANTATSSGFDPSQDPTDPTATPTTSAPDTALTMIGSDPELTVEKTAGAISTANGVDTGATNALDTIAYAYRVINTGNVTMSAITVADAGPTFNGVAGTGTMGAVSCDATTLAPGAAANCSAFYTLSQADADNAVAGGTDAVANSATTSGFDPSQDPTDPNATPITSAPDTAVTTIVSDPELTIEKTAGAITTANGVDTGAIDALDTISYSYVVTNTGNVTMSAITVADTGPTFNGVAGTGTMGAVACDVTMLAPGAVATCSAIYTLSQADADNAVAGGIDAVANTATGSGFDPSQDPTDPNATPTTSAPDTAVTTIANDPELTIEKTAGAITTANGVDTGATDALDTLTYAYSVSNTGNVTMSAITVADAGPTFNGVAGTGSMGAVSCDVTTLAPAAVASCSAVYTLSQGDADNAAIGGANAVANTATASGFDPSQNPATDTATTSAPDTAVTTIANDPELTFEKMAGAVTTANGADTASTDALDTISYNYRVSNTGNVTMSAISIADAGPTFNGMAGTGAMGAVSCDVTTLAPGAVATCSAIYTLSQADADNAVVGGTDAIANTATASGFDPSQDPATDTPITSAPDTALTMIGNDPELTVEKTAGVITTAMGIDTGATDALDTISYRYVVSNTGNVTMSAITVADSGPTFNGVAGSGTMGAVSCDATTLAPGAAATCSAVYTLSQADADNAITGGTDAVTNTATSSGFDPSQDPSDPNATATTSAPDTAVTTIANDPELTIEKSAGAITTANGRDTAATDALDTIAYAYRVTNSGNVTMSAITVADAGPTFNGISGTGTMGAVSCDAITLAPGAAANCSAFYTLSQTDADNAVAGGTNAVANSATASGFDPSQNPASDTPVTSAADTALTTIGNDPELIIEKTANAPTETLGTYPGLVDAGDTITYGYTVTNTGNVTMTSITIIDAGPTFNGVAGAGTMGTASCDATTLAPAAVATCTATYVLAQADVNNAAGIAGGISNVAEASGRDPQNNAVGSNPDTAVTEMPKPVPPVAADNATTGMVGQPSTMNLLANDTLSDGSPATPANTTITLAGDADGDGTVVVAGEGTWTLDSATGDLTFTPEPGFTADPAPIAYTLTENATGLTDTAEASVDYLQVPELSLVKPAPVNADEDGNGELSAGDTLTYTITATNTGTAVLTNVVINDAMITPNSMVCQSPLAVAAVCNLVGTYTVTPDDVAAGEIVNKATADSDQTDESTASNTSPILKPAASLDKAVPVNADEDGNGVISEGDTLTYTVKLTNTGTATLSDVVVSDPMITPNSLSCATLAAGASCTLVGTKVVSETDVNAASIVNTATATTAQLEPMTDSVTVNTARPGIRSIKSAGAPRLNASGTFDVDYSIVVKNTGTVTLDALTVIDDLGAQFGSSLVSVMVAPSISFVVNESGASQLPSANAAFTGLSPATNLTSGTDGQLSSGDSYRVNFTVRIDPNVDGAPSEFNNQASAGGSTGGLTVYDLSDNGGDLDGGNTDVPTPVTPPAPRPELQTTKFSGNPVINSDRTFNVPFTILVKNTGNVNLNRLSLEDNMATAEQLGSAFISIVGSPTTEITNNASGNAIAPTANISFDGRSGDPKLVIGTDGFLAPQDGYAVTFTVKLDPNAAGKPVKLLNQATTTALSPSGARQLDLSDAGNNGSQNASPDDSRDTDEATELVLTTFLVPDAELLVSKVAAKSEAAVGDLIPYTILVKNKSKFSADGVTLVDDLPNGFKMVPGSLKVNTYDADHKLSATTAGVSSGIDPVNISGLSVPVEAEGYIKITYTVKIGTGARAGKQCNTVRASAKATSNTATSCVLIKQNTVLDQSTVIGKVFHDRDCDGYQDPADVTGLTLQSDYFGWNSLHLGGLASRVSVLDNPFKHRKVIRMPYTRKNDFRVTTEQGTVITVDHNGNARTAHVGLKRKGLTGQDVRVSTRRIRGIPTQTPVRANRLPATETDVLEITLINHGIQEEGLPGVRLASVDGLLIETDGYGRYHLPNADGGRRDIGKNMILKADISTLPRGARFCTENPRVIRLTGHMLNKINFGVKLPVQQQQQAFGVEELGAALDMLIMDKPEQTIQMEKPRQVRQVERVGAKAASVEVDLKDDFFVANSTQVQAHNAEVLDQIADSIRQYGGGHIKILSSGNNAGLAKLRANSIRRVLHGKLGNLMGHVKVEGH